MSSEKGSEGLRVVFSTGQVFPIRYYQTTETYCAELPAGVYEAEALLELTSILKKEFDGVKVRRY